MKPKKRKRRENLQRARARLRVHCPDALGTFQCRHRLITRSRKQATPPRLAAKFWGTRILMATTITTEPKAAAVA